jgi:DNA-binding GntR family transcriptional regulator
MSDASPTYRGGDAMPIPALTEVAERRLARDETYDAVRRWIVDGTLEPGEKLRDIALAEALGVSRMPVREALLRLENEGLVETAANRWTKVAALDVGQARQLYPIVWTLECLAVSLLPDDVRPEDVEAMRAANERLRRALDEGDPVAASRADDDVHRVFVERAANREIARILDELKTKLRRLEIAYFGGCSGAGHALAEHAEIIFALESGDGQAAIDAVRANWEASLLRFEASTHPE